MPTPELDTFETATREEVLSHWIELESRKMDSDFGDDDMSEAEMLALLEKCNKPLDMAFGEGGENWHRGRMRAADLGRLLIFPVPEWENFSPEHTVRGVANRIVEINHIDELDSRGTKLKAAHLLSIFEALPDVETGHLILVHHEGEPAPRLVDGNHRAVALYLDELVNGSGREQAVYLRRE